MWKKTDVGSSDVVTQSICMNSDSSSGLYATGALRAKYRSVQQERVKEKVREQKASQNYATCKEESKEKKKDAFEQLFETVLNMKGDLKRALSIHKPAKTWNKVILT
eukprot:12395420-Ditylum_brightwellii.AAC.1